jgi:hypothetical protein
MSSVIVPSASVHIGQDSGGEEVNRVTVDRAASACRPCYYWAGGNGTARCPAALTNGNADDIKAPPREGKKRSGVG